MPAPWVPSTSSRRRLEDTLTANGWQLWWTAQGSLRLTDADGHTIETASTTTARTLRDGYEAAREYAGHEAARRQY
ncbi:hypothetical protein ACMT4L_16845 [Deinococcus sp. A31D244]|uniref:hypothetical protein n=1 Tax=Deinococcus sp. A31D244 TaxID=3397675 RepID=UPI0039E06F1B